MAPRIRFAAALAALVACALAAVLPASAQDQQGAEKPAAGKSAESPAKPDATAAPDNPQSGKKRPPRADRVYIKDLEGTWVARDYVERLRTSKAPHAAARKGGGIAIKIQREGRSYPILITNFQRAVLQAVIDVQPDVKPKSYRLALAKEDSVVSASELTYLHFRGEREADGKFKSLSISEPNFSSKRYLTYVRLDEPLDGFVNRTVLAGKYSDANGKAYEFTEAGDAVLPERKFAYEISLDPSAASCELIQSHKERDADGKERIGFDWEGKELRLYQVAGAKAPYKCAAKPFAVLKPQ
jgi:hypothetical protein